MPVLIVLTVLFIIAVVAVARLRGLLAIAGLVVAAGVLIGFMLPAIIVGKPGMAVALSGSTAIMFIVLYVAHGVSMRTSAALAGTLIGLAVTTALGRSPSGRRGCRASQTRTSTTSPSWRPPSTSRTS
ncbi:YibE/F family protein [Tessaracoccus sp. HDW20]|nr:YibE/F family protein [Tessaracoccus coleopterorum]NHB85028.1 YibE/F family protein [Tessaracoccus coleopterorum]